jgi:hypothetical protein
VKIQDYFRSVPGGSAQSGVAVTLYKHVDNSTVTTATTDGTGLYTLTQSLNPGPVYWSATSGTGSSTRKGSSKSFGMSGPLAVYELVYVLQALGNGKVKGYANQLAVTATGTRSLSINTGAALVAGIPVTVYAAQTVTGTANSSGSTRSDVLVLDVTNAGEAEEGKAVLSIVASATSSTVTAPAGHTYLPLANLTLANAGTTYSVTQIDTWLLDTAAFPTRSETKQASVTTSQTANQTISSTTGESVLGGSITLTNGVIYDVVVRTFLLTATSTANVGLSAWWGSTATAGTEMLNGATTHSGVEAIYTTTVTGTGSAVNFGASVRKTDAAATASYRSGWSLVQAIPRT